MKWGGILLMVMTIAGSKYPAGLGVGPFETALPYAGMPAAKPVFKIYSDPVITADSSSIIIPFTRVGNLILVQGKVDTTEGNFILDTGAPDLVLNLTYFRNYTPVYSADRDQGGITGSVAGAEKVAVENFALGGIKYFRLEADRINLGHLENSKGIKILGLLGMQLFKRFEMIVDYQKNLIYLHLMEKKETNTYRQEMLKDTSAYNVFPIDIMDNKVILHTELAGKKLVFLVDFGAESNVLDSRLSDKIFANVVITKRVLLSGSGTQKTEALYGDLKNMKIGRHELGTLPVLITNLEKMCFSYNECLDGMLGFDFLSLHKIGFNFVTHKMYIWK